MFHLDKQKQFMELGKQTVGVYNSKQATLYETLIHEEFKELNNAIKERDHKEIVDALLDIVVVTCGLILCNAESTYKLEIFEIKDAYKDFNFECTDPESTLRQLSISCHSPMLTINNQDKFIILDKVCELSKLIGLDLDKGMEAVHNNNLTKVIDCQGNSIVQFNEVGKIIKPDSYIKFDAGFLIDDEITAKIDNFIDTVE